MIERQREQELEGVGYLVRFTSDNEFLPAVEQVLRWSREKCGEWVILPRIPAGGGLGKDILPEYGYVGFKVEKGGLLGVVRLFGMMKQPKIIEKFPPGAAEEIIGMVFAKAVPQ